MKKRKEASHYFDFLQPHAPYSNTQSITNSLMDDDGAVAKLNNPSSEGLEFESPKHKILFCPLQLKLMIFATCIIHGC